MRTVCNRLAGCLVFFVALVWLAAYSGVNSAELQDSSGSAIYRDLKPNEFMRRWLVLGPIPTAENVKQPPDEKSHRKLLERDYLQNYGGEVGVLPKNDRKLSIAGRDYKWRSVRSDSDVLELGKLLATQDSAVAYAGAQVDVLESRGALLALGSDDDVRVWLNGKLIHEKVVGRSVVPDQDLIPIRLSKGSNLLLIKIHNRSRGWGFCCRLLGSPVLEKKLLSASARGDFNKVKLLLAHGADPNAKSRFEMTAIHTAKVHGNKQVVDLLKSNGAESGIPMPSLETFVDALLGDLTEGDSVGVAVLVSRGDKILLAKGYGYASLEHHVPVTPKTKFRIGSITKQFTASAILKLAEEGKLSVDDPLSKYLPDFPRADEVRIHQLLHHTSGIRSYTDKPDFYQTVTAEVEPQELIDSFKNDPYDFSPGEGWHYDNSGYFLLGYLVEKISGLSYAEYLKKNFFQPLKMNDTGVHHFSDILANEATGYSHANGKLQKALDWDMSRAGGAGAIYSTVEDLHRWNEAVFGGRVLSKESLAAAHTPVKLDDGVQGMAYGYGWVIGEQRGLKEIQHSGGLHGFVSQLSRYPEHNLTVTVLVNAFPTPPGLIPGSLAHEIAQYVLWKNMKSREVRVVSNKVDAKKYSDYVGRFDYGSAILSISHSDGRLFAQLTGQPKFEIFPQADDVFFWKVVDAQVTFIRDEKGKVVRAVHRQNGQTIQAKKLAAQQETKVDAEVLQKYVGKYTYGGGAILTVTREGDRLFAQMTGQPKLEIFAKSPTEFFWKVVNAQITFVLDEQGKVEHVIHHQAGNKIKAPRTQ